MESPTAPAPPPPDLSVVMPAYNEEASIAAAIDDVLRLVAPHVGSIEIVVADDGSRDRTGEILAALAAREPRLKVVTRPNGGHGPALISALGAARGRAVLLLDADREILLDGFPALWAAYQASGAVFGIRSGRRDGRLRKLISRSLRAFLALLFRRVPKDPNVPLKIVSREAWARAARAIGPDNPLPSVLLALHVGLSGPPAAEIPVAYRSREGSATTYRGWKLVKLCLMAGRTLIAFRFHPDVRALRAGGR